MQIEKYVIRYDRDLYRLARGWVYPSTFPAVFVMEEEEVLDNLMRSDGAKVGLRRLLQAHLRSGGTFHMQGGNPPQDKTVDLEAQWAEVKLATDQDIVDAEEAKLNARPWMGGQSESRKSDTEPKYELMKTGEVSDLPKQAKVVLAILQGTGQTMFSQVAVDSLMDEHAEELKTRQDPKRIFGFYRARLVTDGFLKEL